MLHTTMNDDPYGTLMHAEVTLSAAKTSLHRLLMKMRKHLTKSVSMISAKTPTL